MRRTVSPLMILFSVLGLLGIAFIGHAQNGLPKGHPKYKVAHKIYKDLQHAIGDGRTAPTLRIQPIGAHSRMRVAWFVPKSNEIVLEEKTYDLCTTMGTDSLNALAVLLSHELAHFYKDHVWLGDFGNGFADLEVGQKLKAVKTDTSKVKLVEIETEADYFGGFFGYVAGYNTLGVAPSILESIYQEFELGDNIPGYPSLSERQEIALRSEENLRAMVPIFDAGTRLMILGEYEEAARCFDYIARTFPSREILNNAGVARALEAISLYKEGELRFVYPFELDTQTRLSSSTKADEFGFGEENEERIARLLEEAMEWFKKAAAKDEKYATAYVNMACVAELQGEYDEAVFTAKKAKRLSEEDEEKNTLANAHIALGIATANGEKDEGTAKEHFEAALAGNKGLASANLSILSNEGFAFAGSDESEKPSPKREKIDDIKAVDYDPIIDAFDDTTSVPRIHQRQNPTKIYARTTANWYGLVIDTGYKVVSIIETSAIYNGQSGRDIRRGDSIDKVLEAYGKPGKIVAGRQGSYYLYEGAKVIFEVGAEGEVRRWMTFSIKEG